MTTKLRWTTTAVPLFILVFLAAWMPSPVSACAVCHDIPVYLPDGGSFVDRNACMFGWPSGAMLCSEFQYSDGRQGCVLLGNWCNEMEITESDEPEAIALAEPRPGCQPLEMTTPSQPARVTTVR